VSYHHYNRLLDHWQPKRKPEGQILAFGSKERYESLSPGAVAVAQFVAGHLNKRSNYWEISQKTLEAKLGFTRGTIVKALKDLVAWGVFTRSRANNAKPYNYRLAIECPVDCARLADHNTESELARLSKKQTTSLPKKQETPAPKKQTTGGLENSQLIETNKQLNKEVNRARSSCFSCTGVFEILSNGKREIIHSHDCEQLKRTMSGQGWNITQGEIGSSWDSLDTREQQIANYLSLAKGKERVAKRAEVITGKDLAIRGQFQSAINRTLADNELDKYEPLIHEWLWIVYQDWYTLADTHINQAVKYTKLGWHLKPDGDWRKGKMINSDHFIEGDENFADLDWLEQTSFMEVENFND
jgi:hypothetical protein